MKNIDFLINRVYVTTVKALLHTIRNSCMSQSFKRNMIVLLPKIKSKINL